MKPLWQRARILAAAGVLLASSMASALESGALESIRLLPPTESFYGAASIVYFEEQIGRKLSKEESQLLERKADGGWRRFSDELIEFEVPDDPILKVELFEPEEKPELRIVGGAVGTTDKSFQRVYRMTFNGLPYGMVLVSGEEWFDEGICFCGPINLKSFLVADGNLLEFSQLPDGAIKKVQVINDRHRAVLFEWTHSSIGQEAYARIGASLRLKPASDRTVGQWRAFSLEQRKEALAGMGWLRIGTPEADVMALLGEPKTRTKEELCYESVSKNDDGSGSRETTRLPLKDGLLQRFGEKWSLSEEVKPERGTKAWIRETLRSWEDMANELEEGKLPALPQDDVKLLLDLYHEKAETAVGEEWDDLCRIVQNLADLGIKDEEACKVVVKRFPDNSLPQFAARWVLELYEVPNRLEMFHRRLEFVMRESQTSECHNLFSSLEPETNERSRELLRLGLSHENDEIREDATYFLDGLPREEALRAMKEKLKDRAEGARRWAILHVDDYCGKADEPWLKAIAETETSEVNRKELFEKIGELK